MYQASDYKDLLELDNLIFIDVRSEDEYNRETIPGAINMPILNNDQRKEVSIIYDHVDHEKAKELAIKYASSKLEDYYRRIRDLSENHNVCLFCYRGSMRSTVLFNLLNSLGLNIYKLRGGYKAYRKYIYKNLDPLIKSFTYINLNGFTGVGKTEILHAIERRGYNSLNLEGLANNRGSLLGGVGLGDQPSQKMFESLLYNKLSSFTGDLVFVESESSKVGDIYVPKTLKESYSKSNHQVYVSSPIESRLARIRAEYLKDDSSLEDIKDALHQLSRHIGKKNAALLEKKLDNREYDLVIEELIVRYYDINYSVKRKNFELEVNNTDSDQAAGKILAYYNTLLKSS